MYNLNIQNSFAKFELTNIFSILLYNNHTIIFLLDSEDMSNSNDIKISNRRFKNNPEELTNLIFNSNINKLVINSKINDEPYTTWVNLYNEYNILEYSDYPKLERYRQFSMDPLKNLHNFLINNLNNK